ncbi:MULTISPECIES: hypothetical protein [unclassified Streptomyces]|uniref:hypothetical protein n=1 Tax=unclassified Streptomyces TaxID=2593676 RepID=UPI000F028A5B|nr:hypothetical protein [Streptomyces sp. Tu 4128]
MSFSASPRPPSGPRRRSLLVSAAGAAGAVLLVGCSGDPEAGEPAAERSAADAARARAGRDSEALAARYAAVIAAHPGLAERLRPLREEVLRHAKAFGAKGTGGTASTGASSGASPSVSARAAGPGDDAGRVPADEKDAVALLAGAERKLADRRAEALLEVPGELARLLASVAAAGAAHVYLLTDGG